MLYLGVHLELWWCYDIGREHAANKPRLSKNRFPGHDEIGQNNVTLVIRDKTRVKIMEVSRKFGHATQANDEGSLVFTHVV
ncbi:hypothetical protein Hanom_Chr02g00138781 [Helianthus anomalus]